MTALTAEKFIKRIVKDNDLRSQIYNCPDFPSRMKWIAEQGYSFTYGDFDDAINHLKVECPTEEQADLIGDISLWWQLLNQDCEHPETQGRSCSPQSCFTCSGCH